MEWLMVCLSWWWGRLRVWMWWQPMQTTGLGLSSAGEGVGALPVLLQGGGIIPVLPSASHYSHPPDVRQCRLWPRPAQGKGSGSRELYGGVLMVNKSLRAHKQWRVAYSVTAAPPLAAHTGLTPHTFPGVSWTPAPAPHGWLTSPLATCSSWTSSRRCSRCSQPRVPHQTQQSGPSRR